MSTGGVGRVGAITPILAFPRRGGRDLSPDGLPAVIEVPAFAGTTGLLLTAWIPGFAGMTGLSPMLMGD